MNTSYSIGQRLGHGQFGIVFTATRQQDDFVCAVKRMDRKYIHLQKHEFQVLTLLPQHPNIISFYSRVDDSNFIYIFMEFGGQELWTHLKSYSQQTIPEPQAMPLFKQMAESLLVCHQARICHHDVKLENFLINPDSQQVKLCDFGFSQQYQSEDQLMATYRCSPAYASLSVLRRIPHLPIQTDVFGLGVCFYRVVFGVFPFCDPENDSIMTLTTNLRSNNVSFEGSQSVSQRTVDLIASMIVIEDCERVSSFETINSSLE
eukprot:TRINITY_DN2049_c0_g1_i2.p1 TRINITY_DN2049_c0_g1~~TRINITY_DN2049_c0_g1_i2.p1  ORF type:complete len:261 (-),score=36.92 TRINITY_DN2049_c0_g1_i2:414-1196(-)